MTETQHAPRTRRRIPTPSPSQLLAAGLTYCLLIGSLSVGITMQGWMAKVPAFDLLTYIYAADDFLHAGVLPVHGDTGSYASLKPPGTAWLMLPSRLLSSDPRLAEYAGTALLHVAALVGIFLLARRYFGSLTAFAAVTLYAVSAHGVFLAGSLWPNGRPDFFVFMVLLASQWVTRHDPRFLAASFVVWGVGMYVDMALAPAFLIFPALWLFYRPPVGMRSLTAASVALVVIWSPYLALQLERGFVDIRSQVLLQYILPADYAAAWCDPTRELATIETLAPTAAANGPPDPGGGPLAGFFGLLGEVTSKTLSNFDQATVVPAGGLVLGLLVVAGVLIFSVPGTAVEGELRRARRFAPGRLSIIGLGLFVGGTVIRQVALGLEAGSSLVRLGLGMALGGAAAVILPQLVAALGSWLSKRGTVVQDPSQAHARLLLVLSLLVPWIVLVAFAEPGKPERFWWLWPLQVIFLAALIFNALPRLFGRRLAGVPVAGLVLALLVANGMLITRLEAWRDEGWAGQDSETVEVVDFLAAEIGADGGQEAAIGYQTIVYPFMAQYHITNPVYKVGAEFDMFLYYRHGIVNTDTCAEGVSERDEYRVVQTRRRPPAQSPASYFPEPLEPEFRLLRGFDYYQVWSRAD